MPHSLSFGNWHRSIVHISPWFWFKYSSIWYIFKSLLLSGIYLAKNVCLICMCAWICVCVCGSHSVYFFNCWWFWGIVVALSICQSRSLFKIPLYNLFIYFFCNIMPTKFQPISTICYFRSLLSSFITRINKKSLKRHSNQSFYVIMLDLI